MLHFLDSSLPYKHYNWYHYASTEEWYELEDIGYTCTHIGVNAEIIWIIETQ